MIDTLIRLRQVLGADGIVCFLVVAVSIVVACLATPIARWLAQRHGALLYFGWLLVVIIPYNMATSQDNNDLHLQQREQHHRTGRDCHDAGS